VADTCVMVFTSRSVEQMLEEGGSQAWKLGSAARMCKYLVCTWNPLGEYARPNAAIGHGEAFLVAPIAEIERAPENPRRFIIRFTEYARVSVPHAWNGQRNPFTYASLGQLGIDLQDLRFDQASTTRLPALAHTHAPRLGPLTISMAKEGLSLHYGVDPQSIEITIRG